jgi:hypothetical protein
VWGGKPSKLAEGGEDIDLNFHQLEQMSGWLSRLRNKRGAQ